MPNHLQRAFPEIDTSPLYYISIHGYYDMEKYASGTPLLVTVPDNTIVIETSTIETYCLFTNFLAILKKILVDRPRFVKYLGGDPEDTPLEQKIILTALSSCQYYLPGGTIANRILEATGGVYRYSGHMESERTGDYGNMGFYKYTPGKEEPENIFTERYSQLVAGAYGTVQGKGLKVNTNSIPFETFETMFQRINEFGDTFKIILFSSCGELRDTKPTSSIDKIAQIRYIQTESLKIWNARMRVNYNESRLALKDVAFSQEIAEKFGLTNENYVPRYPRNFTDPQIPNSSIVTRSKKGGSRRFLKKSKSKRKTRKFKRSP
jgi:hypothetical protein